MSLSIADLRALANEYNFDEMEARHFLGLSTKPRGSKSSPRAPPTLKCTTSSCQDDSAPAPKKRGRPPKKSPPPSEASSSDGEQPAQAPKKRGRPPKNAQASSTAAAPKTEKKKRGPSGYNLFVADASRRHKLTSPTKPQKDHMKVIGAEWKGLSDTQRTFWNEEAKK